MTIEKYYKLNKSNKPYITFKGKIYHITNDKNNNNQLKVVCDGDSELYQLVKKYEKPQRKLTQRTSKNYHTLEQALGINPKSKTITCNQTLCDSVKEMSKENVSLECIHTKANYKRLIDKNIPRITSINTTLKHMKQDKIANDKLNEYINRMGY